MDKFQAADLRRFVIALDAHLTETLQVIAIGGGAVALGYDIDVGTKDLDLFEADLARLRDAIAAAKADTGIAIPVDRAAIAELPYNFEDRLLPVMVDELKHLRLFVPERHDLALSKNVRGNDNDLAQLARLHERHPLDLETVVDRFLREMTHVIGNRRDHAYNLLDLIERLWGELERRQVEARVLSVR